MKTRDRIVLEARALFNEQGYGNVTTAMLAAHLGIAEGNLWYHFKTRQALLEAIAEQFASRIETRLDMVPDPHDPIGSYARMLGRLMAELSDFRFIYRDQASYGEHVEPVAGKAPGWLGRTFDQLERYFDTLADAGLLDWPRERLRDLAVNTTIILRYGLEHYREMGEPTGAGSGAVRRTLHRHLTLFEHRLAPEAAIRLHEAIEAIGARALAA
ncbi:MAG: TetR family transcriptional regulator [Novosphingobium sp.]|uniref:TetR/AcrR family transcriptional regulator n=1 Tax=Novosphingobium sp. TaxID=1874826 RepID=UPI001D275CA0|nr:TetR/AcrR family transcriptional regulator [Novosphingobium sp.]MCB2056532.1 TetR family transcriptional regulator [Novosphingobium sp.]MCP5387390.1 TetR family transcriptional regulator [Novosphingobium sp.]